MSALLQCERLTLGYRGEPVVRAADLRIESKELVALLGPNGAGKTTLLAGLCGTRPSMEGGCLLQGDDLNTLSPGEIARRCAVVPQSVETVFGLRVRTLVEMGRYARLPLLAGPGPEDRRAVDQALEETSTTALQDRQADQLSGGELQRVLLARALAQETSLLLLDEPFSSMDAAWRIRCFDILARRRAVQSALIALHDLNLAALYCTRFIFLKHGRIVFDGPSQTLFTEQALSELYETNIKIGEHPVTGAPQAFPVPGAACGDCDRNALPGGRRSGRAG